MLVVDAGAPRNATAGHVHNYLARDGVKPADLLAAGRAEVAGYGGHVITGTVASAEHLDGSEAENPADGARFRVVLADGRSVRARRLLVTTGLVDELPDVPGLAERWGRDVLHCPYCHGWEVRDQAIGVLATGPFGVHGALLFRQWSPDIALFLHTAPAPSEEQTEQLTARGIAVIEGEVAALEVVDDQLTGVRLRSGDVIARQAVVVAPASPLAPTYSPPWDWRRPSSRSTATSSAATSPPTPPGPPRSRACGWPGTSRTCSPRSLAPPPQV
ncbi:MAG: NAD(P)/FAD-dependent oxidoreductase [Geodermatophilaceae bacterium]